MAALSRLQVYYWDSFFVIRGLLASNLTDLAADMVGNFIYLINTYGHIPNGGWLLGGCCVAAGSLLGGWVAGHLRGCRESELSVQQR